MATPPRIVVLGASSALPRQEGVDQLAWEETWPQVLSRMMHSANLPVEVINCSARRRTIDCLLGPDFQEHVIFKQPDIVIIQLGMVDCAPRLFTQRERRLLQSRVVPRWLSKRVINYRSARRAQIIRRNPLAKVYTQPTTFSLVMDEFFTRLASLNPSPRCIVLPILAYTEQMEQKSPGHAENRRMYNTLLRQACAEHGATWIEPQAILEAGNEAPYVFSDGYHLNVEGSIRCSEAIVPVVSEFLSSFDVADSYLQNAR